MLPDPSPRRLPLLVLAALACALVAAAAAPRPASPPPAPRSAAADGGEGRTRGLEDGRPARLEDVAELDCAECHAAIADEWAASLHALAWVDPHYQEALEGKRRPESCHGCHVPAPLHTGDPAVDFVRKPAARSGERTPLDHGIACRTCHLGPEGEILGPWGAPTDAHRSVKSTSFAGERRNDLCITCHRTTIGPVIGIARDFVETGQAAKGKSCVGCHMDVELRPAAVDRDGVASEEKIGRSHFLNGPSDPEFLASAFAASVRGEGGAVTVVLANQAGHRVPGLLTRSLRFEARLVDEAGTERARGELVIDADAYLPADGVVSLPLGGRGAEQGVRVELVGFHHAPGVEAPVRFLEQELEVAR